jgi:ATP-dependent Zn protease
MTGRFELAGEGGDDKKRSASDDQPGRQEVRELLQRAEQAARTILQDNADDLSVIATRLAEVETLTAAELKDLARRSTRDASATDGGGGGQPFGAEA